MQQLSSLRPRLPSAAGLRRNSTAIKQQPLPRLALSSRLRAAAAAEGNESVAAEEVDLEDQVELFMKRQAELESGAAFARTRDPDQVIGGDVVSEDDAKAYCREIISFLRTLKATRDMTINEAKLVVAIEDPRARERRQLGIEDERGVSRDEMAAALDEVAAGRVPTDRLALKCLYEDMAGWPYLSLESEAPAATAAAAAAGAANREGYASLAQGNDDSVVKPYMLGQDARAGEKPQTLADLLPDWVGYGALYGVSAIPVMLVIGTVLILFYNSLR